MLAGAGGIVLEQHVQQRRGDDGDARLRVVAAQVGIDDADAVGDQPMHAGLEVVEAAVEVVELFFQNANVNDVFVAHML